jgi:hypothetical protein
MLTKPGDDMIKDGGVGGVGIEGLPQLSGLLFRTRAKKERMVAGNLKDVFRELATGKN